MWFSLPLSEFRLSIAAATSVLVVAAVTDIRIHKIFNWLTYPAILAGLIMAVGVSLFSATIPASHWLSDLRFTDSLLGLIGCGAIMLFPYHLSRGGAGDVKLAMAIGALIGFSPTIQAISIGYIIAAVYWLLSSTILSKFTHPSHLPEKTPAIPLAGFFACGAFLVACIGPIW